MTRFSILLRRGLAVAAGLVFLPLMSGCFLFIWPNESTELIPENRPGNSAHYRLRACDGYSCMRIYLPEKRSKKACPAAVIFPGGAYGVLAWEKEGKAYAEFLNRHGMAGIVVKYPLGSAFGHFASHPAMINAAQRAIRLTRYHAGKLGIDPNRIGTMGSSAGGHLAGLCAVWESAGDPKSDDPADRVSARPDFAILCYPVVSMEATCTHQPSRKNLAGTSAVPELLRKLSLEKRITAACPPMFVWQTLEDQTVDPENSRLLEAALKRHGIRSRVIFYEKGPHGMGLLSESERKKYPKTAEWSEELLKFLHTEKILCGDQSR